jgi:hypothetical protein
VDGDAAVGIHYERLLAVRLEEEIHAVEEALVFVLHHSSSMADSCAQMYRKHRSNLVGADPGLSADFEPKLALVCGAELVLFSDFWYC